MFHKHSWIRSLLKWSKIKIKFTLNELVHLPSKDHDHWHWSWSIGRSRSRSLSSINEVQIYYQIPLTPLGQKGKAKKYAKLRLIRPIWAVFAGKFELGLIWPVFGLFGGVRKPKTAQIWPEIDLDLDLKNLRSRSISLQVHLQWTRSHKRSSSAWVISIFCNQDHWSYPSMADWHVTMSSDRASSGLFCLLFSFWGSTLSRRPRDWDDGRHDIPFPPRRRKKVRKREWNIMELSITQTRKCDVVRSLISWRISKLLVKIGHSLSFLLRGS